MDNSSNHEPHKFSRIFFCCWICVSPTKQQRNLREISHHQSNSVRVGSVHWKNTGGLKQKHKKQPFSDASASHLSLVLWHVWFQAEAWISHTTSPTPPSYEVGGIAKRIKTARLRRKTNLQKSDYPKTQIKRYPNSFCIVAGFISHRFHSRKFFFLIALNLTEFACYQYGHESIGY